MSKTKLHLGIKSHVILKELLQQQKKSPSLIGSAGNGARKEAGNEWLPTALTGGVRYAMWTPNHMPHPTPHPRRLCVNVLHIHCVPLMISMPSAPALFSSVEWYLYIIMLIRVFLFFVNAFVDRLNMDLLYNFCSNAHFCLFVNSFSCVLLIGKMP